MGTVCRLPRGEAGFTVRKVGEDPRYLPNTIITPPNRDVLSYRLHASSANWKIHPMSFLYSKNSAFESRFAEPHNILWIRIKEHFGKPLTSYIIMSERSSSDNLIL